MREIYDVLKRSSSLFKEKSVHIMCLSFEERCLAYPKAIKDLNLSAREHAFWCVRLSDENVSTFLQGLRKKHEDAIKEYLPSVMFATFNEIIRNLEHLPQMINIYIDMSGLPRLYIFHILKAIFEKYETSYKETSNVRIFCIYTYPKEYAQSPLQEPATTIKYVFESPILLQEGEKISLLILPGFDPEYTSVGLTHLRSVTNCEPDIYWFIPFPGRTYRFYERVIESHFYFLKAVSESNIVLYPQEELRLSFNKLRKQLESLPEPIIVMPLGCRITCIPTFLSVMHIRKKKRKIDILFPQTSVYDSLRSQGCITPLIEEIPIDITSWVSD